MRCSMLVRRNSNSAIKAATDSTLPASDSPAAPYVLAAAADLKSYRQAKNYRDIPIGYSGTDTAVLRPMLQDYLVCRPNASERLDFYSLNSYEWCGSASSYTISGYNI